MDDVTDRGDAQARAEADREQKRRRLHDWTLAQLGEGWRSAGDGVYYPPGYAAAATEADPLDSEERLDDELLEHLPRATETPVEEPPPEQGRRGWLTRRDRDPQRS